MEAEMEEDISTVLISLKRDSSGKGASMLCRDGGWRNFDASRQVVDARGLSPAQIKQWLDRGPFDETTQETFRGIDGRMLSVYDLFHPDKSLLPKEKSPEQKLETKRLIERQRKAFQERQESGIVEDKSVCVRKQSNYDLTPATPATELGVEDA